MILRIGLILLILPGVVMMAAYFNELNDMQACLSAGGSFNYTEMVCDQSNNHPVIPFSVRHPMLVNGGMLLSVVGLFFCLAGLYTRRR